MIHLSGPEASAAVVLIAGFFTAAGSFWTQVRGKPVALMRHREKLEQIEGQTEVAIAKAQAEKATSQAVATTAESRVSRAAVTALAQRCEALEANLATVHSLLSQQTQKIDLLDSTNSNLQVKLAGLKERISHLEAQAVTDAATIADLKAKLEQARAELAEWVAKYGACDGKAPDLVHLTPQTKARGAKKGKRK